MKRLLCVLGALAVEHVGLLSSASGVEIQSICRLKGQEPLRLTGLGIITGLSGTGDTRFTPTHSAVARAMGHLGNPPQNIKDVMAIKNVALVAVSCEIAPAGGREGDLFHCFVSSIGTVRSLAGGRLLRCTLHGPYSSDETVFALAEGTVTIEGTGANNSGRVDRGARLVRELPAPYIRNDEVVTLVLENAHATFVTANRISAEVNRKFQTQAGALIARAADAKNILVQIPEFAREDVVSFVADLLETSVVAPHTEARVVINEKTSTIVVTGEVEITPALVTHKNLIVFPPNGAGAVAALAAAAATAAPTTTKNDFAPLINAGVGSQNPLPAQLADLLFALNQAQVSADDKIAVIKELAKSGKLHAKVISE